MAKVCRLPALVLAFVISLFAADFWQSKPFTDWTPKDVQKMLQNSPWSKQFSVAPLNSNNTQTGRRGAGGGIPAGGGGMPPGGSGLPGGNAPNPGAIGPANPSAADGNFPGLGGDMQTAGAPPVILVIRWQSSLPVREALVKAKYGSEAGSSPEAKKTLDASLDHYILSVTGIPRATLGPANADLKKRMLEQAALMVKGKEPIKPDDFSVQESGPNTEALFAFPKTTPITEEDKEVEFAVKIGDLNIKQKFRLKDMAVNAKLEL